MWAQRKRPGISVKAVEILRNLSYDIRLVLVGPYKGRRDWMTVKSACPDEELRELYSKALALIHPSEWEGFPYAVLESQACGTQVIIGPGVSDEALINGETSFNASSFNSEEYAEKLKALLDDRSLWEHMSREARKYARNFV